ncbi:hypothetical protein ZIOFF_024126 [Zingiber officinale]|uniref:Uncharacterized protein n=1 Tax=Zingiber officinale TaxID=94328 RepID=A0A8J5H7L8_ZINOF|nr:hypothetical protein ZIOFF_024126 [Zingiber officinale]
MDVVVDECGGGGAPCELAVQQRSASIDSSSLLMIQSLLLEITGHARKDFQKTGVEVKKLSNGAEFAIAGDVNLFAANELKKNIP